MECRAKGCNDFRVGGWGGAGVTAETEGRKPSASVVIEKGPSSDRG